MPNHVHFLLEPLRKGAISRLMQHLQSQHARYMNGLNHTAGHLWHHHFHAKHIKSRSQYCETLLYIERNPVAHGGPHAAHLYAYSSAAAHCTNQPILIVKHKRHHAQVKLYLDRWRHEFEFPAVGAIDWAAWLRSPRQATHARDVAAQMKKPLALAGVTRDAAARGS
jgi:maltooligosyltrehalose synthase